ncbi:PAS domain S-box protein, partial [bacterium]|nr:PAS domain S-box protein [bacterium]
QPADEEILRAIHSGDVDAVVVSVEESEQVFSLRSADYAYRMLIEQMTEGALTLNHDGLVLYCNHSFAAMIEMSAEEVVGSSFQDYVSPAHKEKFRKLFQEAKSENRKVQIRLQPAKGPVVSTQISMSNIAVDEMQIVCVVVTDLTELQQEISKRKLAQEALQKAHEGLERQVKKRTSELSETNSLLKQEIKERKHAEERLRQVVESAPYAIVMVNREGEIKLTNSQTTKYFGYKQNELIGQLVEILMPERFRRKHKKYRADFHAVPEVSPIGTGRELWGLHKNGSEFPVEIALNPIKIGGEVFALSAIMDISERKHAQQVLKESTERLELALQAGKIGIWSWSYQDDRIIWDDRMFEMFGVDKATWGGNYEAFLKTLHPEDVDRVNREVGKSLKEKGQYDIEYRVVRQDGTIAHIFAQGKSVYDKKGNIERMTGVCLDITDQKQTEEKLNETNAFLDSIIENIPNMIFVKDAHELRFVRFNKAGEELIGYSRDELIGKNDHDFFPKKEAGFFTAKDREVLKNRKLLNIAAEQIQSKTLGARILHTKKIPILDESGAPQYLLGISEDITERKQLQDELEKHRWHLEHLVEKRTAKLKREITARKKIENLLRAREEQMRLFVEHTPAAVAMFDSKMRYVITSRRWLEDYGLQDQNIIGRSHYEIFSEIEKMNEWKAIHRRCMAGAVEKRKEDPFPRADGTMDWVRWEIHPWRKNDKKIGGIIMFTEVITDRKRAELERERLLQAVKEKNKELEQIVYVTSHDLRSPLVNIQGFSKELTSSCADLYATLGNGKIPEELQAELRPILQDDIPEALQIIQTSTQKMDSLLKGLLKLSRLGRAALNIRKLNMNRLLSNIARTFEFQLKEAGVILEVEELPACYGDETQINQIFSNLIGNALKYLDPNRSGKLEVTGFAERDRCIYCVEDNGIGIPKNHQQKVFEIFHRLNPDAEDGEGLGLTIVVKILERHQGRIWLESRPGKGSKFLISLHRKKFDPSDLAF